MERIANLVARTKILALANVPRIQYEEANKALNEAAERKASSMGTFASSGWVISMASKEAIRRGYVCQSCGANFHKAKTCPACNGTGWNYR